MYFFVNQTIFLEKRTSTFLIIIKFVSNRLHKSINLCTFRSILCILFGCVAKKQYLCSAFRKSAARTGFASAKSELSAFGLHCPCTRFRIHIIYIIMALKIVVLAKQVPDTRNVGKDAMTAEGTVNRAALPAIFNPEDLNALEQALRLKEQNPGSTVGILTMGPPRAGEIIRQGLYRGADTGWLLTDRLFAGADTLATSYALATAIKKIGNVDIVIGGRQAIDGDTAQVGPQVAQKLGLNQVTYAEEVLSVKDGKATIKRVIDGGVETVEAPLPVVITVNGSAAPCRPQNAKLVMKYKRATCPMERPAEGSDYSYLYEERPYLTLNQWSVADVDGDVQQCGLNGSPTKVKAIKNIVFQAKESKTLTASDADIEGMIKELLEEKIIG